MKKASRMKDIQSLVAGYTADGITAYTYDFNSYNAHDIALIPKIDWTSVSHVLNQLRHEDRLARLQGRPTLYLDAGITHSFSIEPAPYTLPVGRDTQGYLHQDKSVYVWEHSSRQTLTYTGAYADESLYSLYQELLAILMYLQALQSLALCAPYGEGGHHFLKFFMERAKELQLLGKHTQILGHVLSGAAGEQNQIYDTHSGTPIFLIPDAQCSDMHIVQQVAENLQKQHAILHSSWEVCYLFHDTNAGIAQLQRFIDYPIVFSSYEIRTLKERLETIFAKVQRQSDILSQIVCLYKDIITCMALTDKAYATHTSLQELRHSIIWARYSFIQRKANVIDVIFEYLSDSMLNGVRDVSSRFAQPHSVLDLFDGDVLYFIPQTSCRFFTAPHHAVLNEQRLTNSNDDEQIVSICNSMLKKTGKIEINTIRSIFVKELYDLIFPLLASTPLKQKETMIFVLFEYLQNLITELENNTYARDFTPSHGLGTKRTDAATGNIVQIIQSKVGVVLPQDERTLISTHLQLIVQKLEAKTPILLVCRGEGIAVNYEKYIRSANLCENYYSFNYSEVW